MKKLQESLGPLPEARGNPPFIVVSGLAGTWKSHFCRRLMGRYPFTRLESDALRRVLFPSPTYSPRESERLFQACHQLMEELLGEGIPLIFHATNLSERHREHLYRISDCQKAHLILDRVEAPREVVRQRLEERERGKGPLVRSGAGWNVYQGMRGSMQPIRRPHFAVDTSREIIPVIDRVLREASK